MIAGFFNEFRIEVEQAIRRGKLTYFRVKDVRRVMNVTKEERSKLLFISKALDTLTIRGFLRCLGGAPKVYERI